MEHSPTLHETARPAPTGWLQRAQPLLGTLVRIGLRGLDDDHAHDSIARGFAAVADVHRLMSFHEPRSDLSRLNRDAASAPVAVDPHTLAVLGLALEVAAVSDGVFDPTIAPQLVDWGFLPQPAGAAAPDPLASWRDVEIDAGRVRFHRRLWLDFGGIAKGYAVDAALEAMTVPSQVDACVDAGGDLRVAGPHAQRVVLNAPAQPAEALPVLELTDGAVASSTGYPQRRRANTRWVGPHLHGLRRRATPLDRFASVVAPRCAVADALTKVALAVGADGAPAYARFGATAHLFSRSAGGWLSVGGNA